MRALLPLLLLALASAAQAQYYYTDTFASYNSGAWSYPGGSGFAFGGGGLTADGSSFVNKLIAYNNGGNTAQHEVKATFNGLPSGPWYVSADLYLTTNTGGTSGYKIALKNGCFTVYEMSGGSLYTLSTSCFSYTGATTVRAIKTAAGIRVAIGQEVFWTPGASYGGWQGVGIGSNGGGYAITQAQLAPGDLTAPNNFIPLRSNASASCSSSNPVTKPLPRAPRGPHRDQARSRPAGSGLPPPGGLGVRGDLRG